MTPGHNLTPFSIAIQNTPDLCHASNRTSLSPPAVPIYTFFISIFSFKIIVIASSGSLSFERSFSHSLKNPSGRTTIIFTQSYSHQKVGGSAKTIPFSVISFLSNPSHDLRYGLRNRLTLNERNHSYGNDARFVCRLTLNERNHGYGNDARFVCRLRLASLCQN